MVLVDAYGLPAVVNTDSASRAASHLAQQLFDFMIRQASPERIIGDKGFDSEALDEALAERGPIARCRRDGGTLLSDLYALEHGR